MSSPRPSITLSNDEVHAILTAFRAHVDEEVYEAIEDGADVRRGTVAQLLERLTAAAQD
ncbi:hypothetical protein [Azospirillum argentinense]